MKFLYPLGLLGLIGVPVLILIYIIKNKHTEQTVSSTYLWTLSERFLKRKNPFSKLSGIISLILQIAIIVTVSLACARPILVLPGEAREYCFVLDASGSMAIEENGKSRFQQGKEAIGTIINDSLEGSIYTLIYVGDTTNVAFEQNADKEDAKLLLDELKLSHLAVNYGDAMAMAQEYFNANSSTLTYLITDKNYQTAENIEVVNVADEAVNYGVSNVTTLLGTSTLGVSGKVTSYSGNATLTVALYLDGATESTETQTVTTELSQTTGLSEKTFSFEVAVTGYTSVRVRILEVDELALDNEAIVYDIDKTNAYDTLLVSDSFLWEAALRSVGNANLTVIPTSQYTGQTGYGLYIFDSFAPEKLPQDGSVWFSNVSTVPENAGFSYQGEVEEEFSAELEPSTSSASLVKKLMANMQQSEKISVKKYIKYSTYSSAFTMLYQYKEQPIIFTGENEYGNREVVFAFDLGDSNFPMLTNYTTLVRNLLEYSFPDVVEKVSYVCGEKLDVNMLPNCDSISVRSPSGETTYCLTDNAVKEYMVDEVGVYEITTSVGDTLKSYYVYAELPQEERIPVVEETNISLQGEAGSQGLDGRYENLMLLFIILALVYIADWVVYCYDKYQLR